MSNEHLASDACDLSCPREECDHFKLTPEGFTVCKHFVWRLDADGEPLICITCGTRPDEIGVYQYAMNVEFTVNNERYKDGTFQLQIPPSENTFTLRELCETFAELLDGYGDPTLVDEEPGSTEPRDESVDPNPDAVEKEQTYA